MGLITMSPQELERLALMRRIAERRTIGASARGRTGGVGRIYTKSGYR